MTRKLLAVRYKSIPPTSLSLHPLNLAFRFLLELAALAAFGYWGWTQHEGFLRPVVAVGLIILAAVMWGTFRVPGDPGKAPIAISGRVRLLLEFVFFGSAVGLLAAADQSQVAIIFGVVTLIHYLISYDRLRWMLTQR